MPDAGDFTKKDLYELLRSLEEFATHSTDLYALGGTALTLRDIKASTLDIDFNVPEEQYGHLKELFEAVGFERHGAVKWLTQEGVFIDAFHGEHILGTQLLEDALERSERITAIGKFTVYALASDDIIISKLARGDARDFQDIRKILESEEINLRSLATRYRETMELSTVAHAKQKFLDLIEIKFKQWGLPRDEELIEEVRAWRI